MIRHFRCYKLSLWFWTTKKLTISLSCCHVGFIPFIVISVICGLCSFALIFPFAVNLADVEVVALSITAEAMSIELDVPYRLNQKNWTQPTWAYKRLRKRIETVFSQLNDHLMMIRNYAKKPSGLFARMEVKVAAFTVLQYFNLLNHKPIGQVKYALF